MYKTTSLNQVGRKKWWSKKLKMSGVCKTENEKLNMKHYILADQAAFHEGAS